MQVYRGIEILTGVHQQSDSALEHRLVSFLPIDASFSAGQYAELAHAEIDNALTENRRPIVVGGTGLYLRAALCELDLRPPPQEGVRERWIAELQRYGAPALHAQLAQRAPWAAVEIDPNDQRRIVRSLELLDAGELEPPERSLAAVDRRDAMADTASRADHGARGPLRAYRRPRRDDARADVQARRCPRPTRPEQAPQRARHSVLRICSRAMSRR